MSDRPRTPYETALPIALGVLALLEPACERIVVAGSIRRMRDDVGDIELVAVPRFDEVADGLWGERAPRNLLQARIGQLVAFDALERVSGGDRYVKLVHPGSGMQVDLFIVLPPAQFGTILAIRTGPADLSTRLMLRAQHRGFHVFGGALRYGVFEPHSPACDHGVVPTPEEQTFFDRLGMEMAPAAAR